MFGKNPKRPPKYNDGQTLDIVQIFATIQGEGSNCGMPAIFIRLGGCNLACKFCDTEFETFQPMSLTNIIDQIDRLAGNISLVVITGGEPFRQNIAPLCHQLVPKYKVQIETNGTLYTAIDDEVEIICSPKKGANGYPAIRPDLLARITAFKFLISQTIEKYRTVPEVGQTEYNIPVYLQPIDEEDATKNATNTQLAINLAMQTGYNLSLQMHKILGLE